MVVTSRLFCDNLNSKSHRINTFYDERKKVFQMMLVLESKRKDKIKSCSFRHLTTFICLRDVITFDVFGRLYSKEQE